MAEPHPHIGAAVPHSAAYAPVVSAWPAAGRDSPDDEWGAGGAVASTEVGAPPTDVVAVTRAVVQALLPVARDGFDFDTRHAAAVDALHAAMTPWLEEQLFLVITVSPRGFVARGAALGAGAGSAADVAAALAAAGVAALVFKIGITREALATWTRALAGATRAAPEALAARLWAVDSMSAAVRWRDEAAFEDGASLDAWCAVRGAAAAGLDEHADLVRMFDAGPAPGEEHDTDWRRVVTFTGAERERLRREALEPAGTAVGRYARLAAVQAEAADDPAARADGAGALADLAQALVQQRRAGWLRDAFAALRPTAANVDAPWLDAVLERLCAEPNVLVLGEILDDRNGDAADAAALRDLLGQLPGAAGRLAALLAALEPARSRRLACLVLAAVAARDPSTLVESAVGRAWYVVRNIVFVLGRIGDAGVVPHLGRWSRHEDERVRVEVARALGRVRAPAAGELLCALLDDGDARVRQCAVWSLAAREDASVLPRLRQRLTGDRAFRDVPAEERDDFFRAYGRLADDAAFAELERWLTHRSLLGVGWATELRRGAALALGESGRAAAADILRAHAGSRDMRLRDAVRSALETLEVGPRAPRLLDEDDWCEPARIGSGPAPETRFPLEAEDA